MVTLITPVFGYICSYTNTLLRLYTHLRPVWDAVTLVTPHPPSPPHLRPVWDAVSGESHHVDDVAVAAATHHVLTGEGRGEESVLVHSRRGSEEMRVWF